ncbi:MAG: KH domain-containing protein [Candidatus Helarchaeota archaeon]
MRKIPICKICAKTGVLCASCNEKLEYGEISELDIQIAKELIDLEKDFKALSDISFYKAYDIGHLIVLEVGKGEIASIIGPRGKIIKILQDKFKKTFRVIEKTKDVKKILEDLIAPARVFGINRIYLPTGEIESKARIYRSDQKKMPASPEIIEDLISKLINERVRITFE